MSQPVVAIVGRPNVGKSTLFNRLVGFRKAVVHDRPGVTRDRLYEECDLLGRSVLLIDTGGLEARPDTDLLHAMRAQSMVAVEEADVIVFVVDGRAGFTPADAEVADLLRRSPKPVMLAVNKVDGPKQEALSSDFWELGLYQLHCVSAEHGRGVYELCEAVLDALPQEEGPEEDEEQPEEDGPIRIAVIGRPNIGKSTLINRILGSERHLVHDSPGTTMDPIDSAITIGEHDFVLVDTAGVRKRAKIEDDLERFVTLRGIRSIERCHISLLIIDATVGVTEQDAKLANLVIGRGRALLVLVNKWDLVKDLEDVNSFSVEDDLDRRLPHAKWAPRLFISAKTGKGVHRIIPVVLDVFKRFNLRIPTPELNNFLERVVQTHTPPQRHHNPVRLYFATQTRVRPPTFVFFSNTPEGVVASYRRYLNNRMRDEYDLDGVPLKMFFRKRRKLGEEKD